MNMYSLQKRIWIVVITIQRRVDSSLQKEQYNIIEKKDVIDLYDEG